MKIITSKQGSKIIQGQEYAIFHCTSCNHLVPVEEEILCWYCEGKGEMVWVGNIIIKPSSLSKRKQNKRIEYESI